MPRQPSTSTRPSTVSGPEKRAAGASDSIFVRGTARSYIHSRRQVEQRLLGRLEREVPPTPSSLAVGAVGADPRLPHSSQSPPPVTGPAAVSLPPAGRRGSKSVNHSEPLGSPPGCLWTV